MHCVNNGKLCAWLCAGVLWWSGSQTVHGWGATLRRNHMLLICGRVISLVVNRHRTPRLPSRTSAHPQLNPAVFSLPFKDGPPILPLSYIVELDCPFWTRCTAHPSVFGIMVCRPYALNHQFWDITPWILKQLCTATMTQVFNDLQGAPLQANQSTTVRRRLSPT
jgi:hypothetical protein